MYCFVWNLDSRCSVCHVRRLNAEEKKMEKFQHESENCMHIVDEYVALKYFQLENVKPYECPDRLPDGEMPGFKNQAWIITEEEMKHYAALNLKRKIAVRVKKLQEREKYLENIIPWLNKSESMGFLCTKEVSERMQELWIESGQPCLANDLMLTCSHEELAELKAELATTKAKIARCKNEISMLSMY